MNYKQIVLKAVKLRKEDQEIDGKLRDFLNAVSPGQHSTFIERSTFVGFMDAIEIINKPLHEEMSYFFYECNQNGLVTFKEDAKGPAREYKLDTPKAFINYLQKEL